MDLSLSRITKLLGSLHNPHHSLKCIHIAGTNGKGSIASFISSIFSQRYKVGRFTSPHLIHPSDSILIHHNPPSPSKFNSTFKHVQDLNNRLVASHILPTSATSFEILTTTAFLILAEAKVDLAIIEVGMGGTLDATNVVSHPLACVISSIAFDHQNWLGDSIQDIARHKGGIIKEHCPLLVVARQKFQEAYNLIQQIAYEKKVQKWVDAEPLKWESNTKALCQLVTASEVPNSVLPEQFRIPLKGDFQLENAAAALSVVKHLHPLFPLSPEEIRKGLEGTRWPGRMEKREDIDIGTIWIDGAHNLEAAHQLAVAVSYLRESCGHIKWIFAATKGKDVAAISRVLFKPGDTVVLTEFTTPEGMPWITSQSVSEMHHILNNNHEPGLYTIYMEKNLLSALKLSREVSNHNSKEATIMTGSLYLVSDYYRMRNITPIYFSNISSDTEIDQ